MKQLQEEAAGLRASHQLLEELLATVKETAEASQIASIASERSEMPPSPFSTIPFPRDPDYIDRSWLIDQLNEKLCVPHAKVALQGLGGIGYVQSTSLVSVTLIGVEESHSSLLSMPIA